LKKLKKQATSPRRGKPRTPLAQLAPLDVQQRYTVREALAYLRTSRKSLYALIAQGRLRVIKEGNGKKRKGRTYLPGTEIVRLPSVPTPTATTPSAPSAP
jgi:excisionase family DNA binding protein